MNTLLINIAQLIFALVIIIMMIRIMHLVEHRNSKTYDLRLTDEEQKNFDDAEKKTSVIDETPGLKTLLAPDEETEEDSVKPYTPWHLRAKENKLLVPGYKGRTSTRRNLKKGDIVRTTRTPDGEDEPEVAYAELISLVSYVQDDKGILRRWQYKVLPIEAYHYVTKDNDGILRWDSKEARDTFATIKSSYPS